MQYPNHTPISDTASAVDLSNDPRFLGVLASMKARAEPKSTEIISCIEEDLQKLLDKEKQEFMQKLLRELQGLLAVLKKGSTERIVGAAVYNHFRPQIKDKAALDEIELFTIEVMPANEMTLLSRYYSEAIPFAPSDLPQIQQVPFSV